MKVLILGAGGMLGSELNRQLSAGAGNQVSVFDSELDVTDKNALAKKVSELKPEIIFNCVAFNNVDLAEAKPELAYLLNASAVANIAQTAAENGSVVAHYSTGYVFDGASQTGYNEDTLPNPQSVYAKSKFRGEQILAEILPNHYIIRLNLLFGPTGLSPSSKQSFPEKIMAAAQKAMAAGQSSLDLVSDQISTPTYSPDLAAASIKLVTEKHPFGIYHLPNDGQASWYDWAKEIFSKAAIQINLNSVLAAQFNRAAAVPKNSVLLNTKFPKLRSWQEATDEFIANLKK